MGACGEARSPSAWIMGWMSEYTVSDQDTAEALGSGDVSVLGTPRLIAWLEAETCVAVQPELDPGQTTVGLRVEVEHLAASPVGSRVRVSAVMEAMEQRTVTFMVGALDPDSGRRLAHGTITRVVVNRERFLARVRPV